MSPALQKAFEQYRQDRPAQALVTLQPLLVPTAQVDLQVLLLAGQCSMKTGEDLRAANYFLRAAAFSGTSEETLRTLAKSLARNAKEGGALVAQTRKAARAGAFDPEAEAAYRASLRHVALVEEMLVENQRLRDQMAHRGNAAAFAVDHPRDHLLWSRDEDLNARQMRIDTEIAMTPQARAARHALRRGAEGPVRLGYLLAALDHAPDMPRLLLPILAAHDKASFHLVLICQNRADAAQLKKQSKALSGVDTVPLDGLDDDAAAKHLRALDLDVLIDLSGHGQGGRPGILNSGVAPVQAIWCGAPCPSIGIDCDYVIADAVALPPGSEADYREQFCLLPETFIAAEPTSASRQSASRPLLPDGAVLFGAFGPAERFTPQTLTLWRSLLQRLENGFLWLDPQHPFAEFNLFDFMEAGGVGRRIIFAQDASTSARRARCAAADIGLDSTPCGGFAETLDMLCAGVPVVTLVGSTFASRRGASLLCAAGQTNGLARDEDDYLTRALDLAEGIMERRGAQISAPTAASAPLFDPARFVVHLQKAIHSMAERARSGVEPQHLRIDVL
ncbi:hypothetical protein BJF93_06505 [Xaviernesmea oryzae]|uniref:O-GlcNAc transferase C-terminal domain-containing protein n=1 Tax=Xaviernesmea oryzae TaxID=464029 RepID=A0A1Q9AS40_9HYPH|nr:hypothetical protein [Xaviernesmea oryzae]OLP58263.1 hypothetical protein BJF93_06505 [Xaviernesmea oryzae]SEL44425.1 Glycosyl transferase family 41 [Xaviernesmea oryzae]